MSQETSENPANKTVVPATLPQLTPTLVSLLEVIEPEVLYAGYDSSVPDSTWRIMTTLNMLGGRQVIAAVKWAKAIPGKTQERTQLRYKVRVLFSLPHFWGLTRGEAGKLGSGEFIIKLAHCSLLFTLLLRAISGRMM